MSTDVTNLEKSKRTPTQFFLKGLAISLPPILTLVILLWIGGGINHYIIQPIAAVVRYSFAQFIDESRETELLTTMKGQPPLEYCGRDYRIKPQYRDDLIERLERSDKQAFDPEDIDLDQVYVPLGRQTRSVPYHDYALVARHVHPSEMPKTAIGLYMEVVTHRHFQGLFGLSAFAVAISIVLLYFLGRIVTARLGAWAVTKFETVFLSRLPVISNVYSSVKQVTDFLFSERTIEYNRVVAVEYPRKGIWSLGFVTGDSMLEMTAAAGEPLVSVLIPTSPMPVTGYTMSVPKNEVLDLNITIDQAFQYCISCGVLVPQQQRVTPELLQQELAKRLTGASNRVARAAQKSSANRNPDSHAPESGEPKEDHS